MKALHTTAIVLSALAASILFVIGAYAASAPTSPSTITPGASSTFNSSNYAVQSVNAIAGNITFITIDGISQTRGWQGYYGNVTGTITLDDASNNTFYNWSNVEPRGQLYATTASSVSWPNVVCANITGTGGAGANNGAANFHQNYGFNNDDYDNVTITYYDTNHPSFEIIDTTISGCPTTYIFRDDGSQTTDFVNFLLFDSSADTNGSWVFGTTLENKDIGNKTDISCYNGDLCDFQLLVAEDGHGTDTSVTPYYFWLDIIG